MECFVVFTDRPSRRSQISYMNESLILQKKNEKNRLFKLYSNFIIFNSDLKNFSKIYILFNSDVEKIIVNRVKNKKCISRNFLSECDGTFRVSENQSVNIINHFIKLRKYFRTKWYHLPASIIEINFKSEIPIGEYRLFSIKVEFFAQSFQRKEKWSYILNTDFRGWYEFHNLFVLK